MKRLAVFSPEGMEADRGALEQIEPCIADERATRGAYKD
jgi:hypothetical protein